MSDTQEPLRRSIITSGSRGLGHELVKLFLAADFEVTATCTDTSMPHKLAELLEFQKSGPNGKTPRLIVKRLDYENYRSVRSLAAAIKKTNHPIDAIIHNGAIGGERNIQNTGTERRIFADRQKVLMTNCEGPLILSETLLETARVHTGISSAAAVPDNYVQTVERLGIQHYAEAKLRFQQGFAKLAERAKQNAISGNDFDRCFLQISPGGKNGTEYNAAIQTDMTKGFGEPIGPTAENIFHAVQEAILNPGEWNGRCIGHARVPMIGLDTREYTYQRSAPGIPNSP